MDCDITTMNGTGTFLVPSTQYMGLALQEALLQPDASSAFIAQDDIRQRPRIQEAASDQPRKHKGGTVSATQVIICLLKTLMAV